MQIAEQQLNFLKEQYNVVAESEEFVIVRL